MDVRKIFTGKAGAVITLGSIVLAAFLGVDNYLNTSALKETQEELAQVSQQVYNLKNERDTFEAKALQLENKLANLRTQEDLMKRDLYAYIKAKYKTIPNILAKEISDQTVDLCKKHNAPFPIVVGIMEVESHFNPMAVSSAGARGLMQVMPFWVKKMDFVKTRYDLHDIDVGIEAGIVAFKKHLAEAKNNIATGLYYYVGKDNTYKNKVFSAMGEFVAFRATVDDDKINAVDTEVEKLTEN